MTRIARAIHRQLESILAIQAAIDVMTDACDLRERLLLIMDARDDDNEAEERQKLRMRYWEIRDTELPQLRRWLDQEEQELIAMAGEAIEP